MNKKELIAKVVEETGFTKKDVEEIVNKTFEVIADKLNEHESVAIPNFGKFEVRERSERIGRNPASGETMTIPASHGVAFKVSSVLKKSVKGE